MQLQIVLIQLAIHLCQLSHPWDYSDDTAHAAPWSRTNLTLQTTFLSEISDYSKRWVPQNPPQTLQPGAAFVDLPKNTQYRGLYQVLRS